MFLALTLLLISCGLPGLLGPEVPAPIPGAVDTIVVLTAGAADTETAAAVTPTWTPTFTPSPTRTPTITPSPTPTFLFFVFTPTREAPTAAASGDYQCTLTGQTPADGMTFSKGETFATTWTVKNTGSVVWDPNTVDFAYVSGTKLAAIKLADLPKSVAIGKSIALKITMTAPSTANTYQTTWSLQQGNNNFCKVTLSIVVK